MSGRHDTNWPRSRWRKWKTATRAATDRVCPRRGAGRGLWRAARETAQRLQGALRSIRSPHTDSDFFARRNRPVAFRINPLETVASGTQWRALNSPAFEPTSPRAAADFLRQQQAVADLDDDFGGGFLLFAPDIFDLAGYLLDFVPNFLRNFLIVKDIFFTALASCRCGVVVARRHVVGWLDLFLKQIHFCSSRPNEILQGHREPANDLAAPREVHARTVATGLPAVQLGAI